MAWMSLAELVREMDVRGYELGEGTFVPRPGGPADGAGALTVDAAKVLVTGAPAAGLGAPA